MGWALSGSDFTKLKPGPALRAWLGLGLVGLEPRLGSQKGNTEISASKKVSHNMNMIAIWYKNCQALHDNVYQSLVDLS